MSLGWGFAYRVVPFLKEYNPTWNAIIYKYEFTEYDQPFGSRKSDYNQGACKYESNVDWCKIDNYGARSLPLALS